jgi:hypothetical protein
MKLKFNKTDTRYWTRKVRFHTPADRSYSVSVQYANERRRIGLKTADKEQAGALALKFYLKLRALGWDETLRWEGPSANTSKPFPLGVSFRPRRSIATRKRCARSSAISPTKQSVRSATPSSCERSRRRRSKSGGSTSSDARQPTLCERRAPESRRAASSCERVLYSAMRLSREFVIL